MSMLVRFSPSNLDGQKYDAVKAKLDEGGHWPPDGLEYHVCFGDDGALKVSEIWSSEEQFQAFGERLQPILGEVGVEMSAPPEQLDIHNQERF
jgi:hypothetical protein